MDSNLQIQISKKWIVAYTEFSYINYGELRCDSVIIALKAMNSNLQLVLNESLYERALA